MKIECPKCNYYYSDDLATNFIPGEGPLSELVGSEGEKKMIHRLPFIVDNDFTYFKCPVCDHVFKRDK